VAGGFVFERVVYSQSLVDIRSGDRDSKSNGVHIPVCVRRIDVRNLSQDTKPPLAAGRALFDKFVDPDSSRFS